MKTDYVSVRFRYAARVMPGKPRLEIDASDRIKLTRVTDGGRDELHVAGVGIRAEVPWSNVASATRAAVEAKASKKADE
jgi:hypothetical protein